MKRLDLMDALKSALQAAFPDAPVEYWRYRPVVEGVTPVAIVIRDIGGSMTKVGHEHEHRVRVEVGLFVFSSTLGDALNEQLDKAVRAIGSDPSLGQRGVFCELIAFAHDVAGDGFESGACRLSIDVVYRTKAWDGV